MSIDHARRQHLVRLMRRREDFQLNEALQSLNERQAALDEAQLQLSKTRAECESDAAAARAASIRGTMLDPSIQSVIGRARVDRYRLLAERRRSVERLTDAVDTLRTDVAERRTRIRKLESGELQLQLERQRVQAIAQSNEHDAMWLGARNWNPLA